MNDLRSPLEDRPYRPAAPQYGQQSYDAGQSVFSEKFGRLRQHRFFPLGSVIAAVIVFGAIISYAYNQGSQSGVNATTPVVTAANEDYKTKPENPGGMDVPFQDAVVFDQLQSTPQTASTDSVESLLPAPEQTAAITASTPANETTTTASTETPANATNTETNQTISNVLTQDDVASAPAVTNTTTATTETETVAVQETKPAATETPVKKLASVAPAATNPKAKIESGSYRIQLGAFRDEAAARVAWSKFKGQYSSQLASVTPAFPRADLPKGTFYRVQGVNLSKASADQICGNLNAAKSGSCIVTK